MGTNVDPSKPSKGLGDTIAKTTKALKIDKIVDAINKLVSGKDDCGCEDRRKLLNELFPYGHKRKFKVLRSFNIVGNDYEKDTIIEVSNEDEIHNHVLFLMRDKFIEEI